MREDWIEVELGELSLLELGGDWGKDPNIEDDEYLEAYCIRGSEFRNWENDKGKTASLRKIKRDSIEKRNLLLDDILVEISGGGPEQPVGRTVVIEHSVLKHFKDKNLVCTNFLRLIRPSDFVNSIYLNYYLKYFYSTGKIIRYQSGSNNLRNLKFNDYLTIEIPFAPLPIQRAIVSKIEALFSDLDNGIANFKKAQEQLKIYRQAVLKKAFQGGLSNILRTDELPLGWIEGELGNIISISSGKGLTKENREDDGVYFVYGGNGITGKHSEFLYENEKLIIGRVGVHCGNVHITKPKSWITDNAFVVSFDEDVFDLHFLHYFLTNLNLNKYASSTAQPVISQGKIYPIEISYPNTKEEQNQIVQEIESRLSVCDKMEQSINESIEKAEALRQSILKKAFEGKLLSQAEIEQCKQAADYEPASELLKKIQAEKLAKEQEKKKKPTDKKKSKK